MLKAAGTAAALDEREPSKTRNRTASLVLSCFAKLALAPYTQWMAADGECTPEGFIENLNVSERTRNCLRVAYERIHSLSLVHEHIYRSKTLADLDLGEYVESLATHLYQSYCPDRNRIRMEVKTEPMRIAIDQAIPCGLILNELISNALKHAFNDGRHGLLEIVFRTTADHGAELVVADDGTGIPAKFDLQSAKSMGMQVVAMLTRQMEACLEILRESGTRFVLSWSVLNTQRSVTETDD